MEVFQSRRPYGGDVKVIERQTWLTNPRSVWGCGHDCSLMKLFQNQFQVLRRKSMITLCEFMGLYRSVGSGPCFVVLLSKQDL